MGKIILEKWVKKFYFIIIQIRSIYEGYWKDNEELYGRLIR